MSDLIERLRPRYFMLSGMKQRTNPSPLEIEAADEIERLRAELATRDAAIDALKSRFVRAVAEEQELPGAMPIEMWEEIRRDRDAAAECLRIVVRKTKSGILARLNEPTP